MREDIEDRGLGHIQKRDLVMSIKNLQEEITLQSINLDIAAVQDLALMIIKSTTMTEDPHHTGILPTRINNFNRIKKDIAKILHQEPHHQTLLHFYLTDY